MQTLGRLLTWALGLFLISAGVAKFAGGHVFQYIEYKSGVDLFYPYVNHLTGLAEVAAGGFILFRRTRLAGAALASVVLVGAIGFHLSPWLGVSIPTGLTDGAASPWTAADFASTTTSATFVMAVVAAFRTLAIVRSELHARESASGDPRPGSVLIGASS
ncbi:MAG: hypothetical protein AAF480_08235 [Actinomycetota bacterium]